MAEAAGLPVTAPSPRAWPCNWENYWSLSHGAMAAPLWIENVRVGNTIANSYDNVKRRPSLPSFVNLTLITPL